MPTDKGANAGLKLSSLVAGMAAGADSIEDMALLRHGGMGRVFTAAYAPSTLGSFLRSFTFGHVRQVDAVASRFLLNLAEHTELLGGPRGRGHGDRRPRRHHRGGPRLPQAGRRVRVLRGAGPQRAARHGLHRQIAPVIAAQRLRKGIAGSPRGAARLATDTLALIAPHPAGRPARAGAGRLGVLLPRPGRRGAQRRR